LGKLKNRFLLSLTENERAMRRLVRVLSFGVDFRDTLGGDCENTNENLIGQSDGAIRGREIK
jgi:hypothetical protein